VVKEPSFSVMRVELREAAGSGRRRRPWMEAVGGDEDEAEMQPRIRERAVSSSSVFVMVEWMENL